MKYIDIEVVLKHDTRKLIYRIWKVDEKHFIVWDYYLNEIHEVTSRLDIFPILNNCIILNDTEKPKIGSAIMSL